MHDLKALCIKADKMINQKTSPRQTRGFAHAGIALIPRRTRQHVNAICQLRFSLLTFSFPECLIAPPVDSLPTGV